MTGISDGFQDRSAIPESRSLNVEAHWTIESFPDALIGHALDGSVLSWNRAAQEFFGWAANDVTGLSVQGLLKQFHSPDETMYFLQATRGLYVSPYSASRRTRDGTVIQVSVRWAPNFDTQGKIRSVNQIVQRCRPAEEDQAPAWVAQAFIASSSEAIAILSENARTLVWNATAEALLGYSVKEIREGGFERVFRAGVWESVKRDIEIAFNSGESSSGSYEGVRKDGTPASLEIRWSLSRGLSGMPVAVSAVIRDGAEPSPEARRSSPSYADLERLLDQSPGMVSYWNADWTNRYANRAYAEGFGTTPTEMRGRHLVDIIGAEHFEGIRSSFACALAGTPQTFEDLVTDLTGKTRHYHVEYRSDGLAMSPGLFVFCYDVTRERRAEKDLQATVDQQRRLYEATPAMLHSVDLAGNIVAVSDLWLKKLGYARDEVIGRPSIHFLSPGSQKYARLVAIPQLRRDGMVENIEYQMVRKDGSQIDVLYSAVSERDAEGRVVRNLEVIEDITDRRRAEDALLASEVFLDRVGRVAGVGGWSLDLVTQVLHWSDHTFRIHELETSHAPSVAEAITYYAPEARVLIESAVNACMTEGTPYNLELPFITAKGRRIWVRAMGEALRADGKIVKLIGAFQDISVQRATQDALRASRDALEVSESRLRLVVDNAPALIAYIDTEERYRFYNGAYERWFGVNADEMRGRTILETLGPQNYASLSPHIGRVLSGEVVQFQRSVSTKSGPRWVEACYYPQLGTEGQVIGFHAFAWDRTEAHIAEAKLAESEQRLKTVIANVPAMIGYVGMDGLFQFGNRTYANWFGVDPDKLPGRTVLEVLGPELYARSEPYVTAALNGVRQRFERAFRDAEGNDLKAHVEYLPDIVNGRQLGMYAFAFDVTALNRLVNDRTRELVEAKNAAEKASRVKDEIIANVSHEMRTPLHGIVGFAGLGLSRLAPDSLEKCRTYFERIRSSGQRLTKFVDQILQLARLSAGELQPDFRSVDLVTLVHRVKEDMQVLFDEKELDCRVESFDPQVSGDVDASLIERVVSNLLSNSKKFSPAGGTVVVSIEAVPNDGGSNLPSSCVRITVEDEGPGIPEAELEQIFDPFVQSSRTHDGTGGTGLGLSIARRIAILHGGTLLATNRSPKGARLVLTLPAMQTTRTIISAFSAKTVHQTAETIPLAG